MHVVRASIAYPPRRGGLLIFAKVILGTRKEMGLLMTYYEILEVIPQASPEVIKNAYRALAKKCHPDLQPNENAKQSSESAFKTLTEAYEVLSNTKRRKIYDLWLDVNNSQEKAIYPKAIAKEPVKERENRIGMALLAAAFSIVVIVLVVLVVKELATPPPTTNYWESQTTAPISQAKENEALKKDMEILNISIERTNIGKDVVGRVRNNSTSTTYPGFIIECIVYDKDNSILETVKISTNYDIPPGEVLKFNHFTYSDLAVSVKPTVIRNKTSNTDF